MAKVSVVVYVHGSDEQCWNIGEKKLGLTGDALRMFSHACDEFKLTFEVDTTTGLATVTHIDGRLVERK